jgi:hypothetical protein
MKTLWPGRSHWIAALALLLLGAVPACSNKQTLVLDDASFNSAPAELRDKWKAAAQYAAGRNYLGAATNLIDLFNNSKPLTAEQNDALTQAWLKLGNQAFAAAETGDKAATEAVLKMKETGIGQRRGRQ